MGYRIRLVKNGSRLLNTHQFRTPREAIANALEQAVKEQFIAPEDLVKWGFQLATQSRYVWRDKDKP